MNRSEHQTSATPLLRRAWYGASIQAFLETDTDSIVGQLATHSEFAMLPTQRDAWLGQIRFLKASLRGIDGAIYLEFSIPRMGRRIDTVLLIGPVIFVVEFKVGGEAFERTAIDQVWDYALDLKNFHLASHTAPIVPLLVATKATKAGSYQLRAAPDAVYWPLMVLPEEFRKTIDAVLGQVMGSPLDADRWSRSPYQPTPTIVEAARALYARHSVEAIARHDAGAQNLQVTAKRIEELVDEAKSGKRKIICFVTGVPGAGKTLVGLNLATQRPGSGDQTHAVYLSGNAPLVAVLREALTRDELARRKRSGERVRKGRVAESVKAFIQNVHHFRDEALIDTEAPSDHVVIFDEAQRAWNARQTANFMSRKKNVPGFVHSEPEFLISYMDRHRDWAAVVCLVGGGQEINTGEAGIDAWIQAIQENHPDWHMYISSRLTDSEYSAGQTLAAVRSRPHTHLEESLHLAVSMRSFRAEHVSGFVKAVLDGERQMAQEFLSRILDRYPLAVTRDLDAAKEWTRSHARGSERYGMVASSKAQRLKPHAIDIRVEVNPVHWFLNDKDDTRSSYYLEDAATEFQVQGLEVDWACVTWDGDLRHCDTGWSYHDFRGRRWTKVSKVDNQRYLLNAYRVLLTRARQGMVIFVPPGVRSDPTRASEYYDPTFRYLEGLGVPVLK